MNERNETALRRAKRVGLRAAAVGFDWENAADALEKVVEETGELSAELTDRERATEELGDLLFAVVNVARKLDIDPEEALHDATSKFERRFAVVLDAVARSGRVPQDVSLDELESFWVAAKEQGEDAQ